MAATVLVVEDEAKIQALLTGYMEALGYRTLTAATGEDALAQLTRAHPEGMLLDISLKGARSGREVLPEAKRVDPTLVVIVMTGLVEVEAEEFLTLGATAFLRKPVNLPELKVVLARHLPNPPGPAAAA